MFQTATSLAYQALLAGPQTTTPPSYNGAESVVIFNLGFFIAYTWVSLLACFEILRQLWAHRFDDKNHPANITRKAVLCVCIGFVFRGGGEALVLWAWNPRDLETAALVRTIKHYTDPIGVFFYLVAMTIGVLAWPALMTQLSRKPLPTNLWTSLPKLWKPVVLISLGFFMAIGVAITR